MRAALIVAIFFFLAACQTPHGGRPSSGGGFAKPNPHYKVGTPYQVAGRWYYPQEDDQYDAIGIASWYGDAFHGKLTANGEVFDMRRLSAAHTTLPMPVMVEVENLENGRKLMLRVNDRGPFVDNRIIDLSRAAATYLGYVDKGLARVRVRYVGRAELYEEAPIAARRGRASAAPTLANANGDIIQKLIVDQTVVGPEAAARDREIWIDVASFSRFDDLEHAAARLKDRAAVRVVTTPSSLGGKVHRLQMGPYFDALAADARLAALREEGYQSARIVR